MFALGFLTNEVDHCIDSDAADQFLVVIDDGRRDEVVTLEGLRRFLGKIVGAQVDAVGLHQGADFRFRIVHQQHIEGQHPFQALVAVDHEQLVGMVWQFVETTEVTQDRFQADVLAHRDHFKIHDRANRILGVGHRRPQLLALFRRQRAKDILDHLLRQIGCQVGQFVGVQAFGGGAQFGRRHRFDQRLANGIRDFQQDFAIAVGTNQVPDQQALIGRQCFQNIGDVGRVHAVQSCMQLHQMLFVHQIFDQSLLRITVARHLLPVHQIFDQPMLGKQILHLGEMRLQFVCVGVLQLVAHAASPLPSTRITTFITTPVLSCGRPKSCRRADMASTAAIRKCSQVTSNGRLKGRSARGFPGGRTILQRAGWQPERAVILPWCRRWPASCYTGNCPRE